MINANRPCNQVVIFAMRVGRSRRLLLIWRRWRILPWSMFSVINVRGYFKFKEEYSCQRLWCQCRWWARLARVRRKQFHHKKWKSHHLPFQLPHQRRKKLPGHTLPSSAPLENLARSIILLMRSFPWMLSWKINISQVPSSSISRPSWHRKRSVHINRCPRRFISQPSFTRLMKYKRNLGF